MDTLKRIFNFDKKLNDMKKQHIESLKRAFELLQVENDSIDVEQVENIIGVILSDVEEMNPIPHCLIWSIDDLDCWGDIPEMPDDEKQSILDDFFSENCDYIIEKINDCGRDYVAELEF